MKKRISSIILLMIIIIVNCSMTLAAIVDVDKLEKVTIKYFLDDGSVGTAEVINNNDKNFSKSIEATIDYYWNSYTVKEIQAINDIPISNTQFAKYAGSINKKQKGLGGNENFNDVVKDNESKSIKDIITSADQIKVKVNGIPVKFDVPPYITGEGRTMVPFRAIFEAIGAKVDYDFTNPAAMLVWADKKALGKKTRIDMKIGSKWVVKSGVGGIQMDVSPEVKDGRTFIPVRYASELLGGKVEWKEATNEVIITMPEQ